MRYLAGFAVHEIRRTYDLASERGPEGLVAEAHSQDRQFAGEVPKNIHADPGFLGCARARGNKNARGSNRLNVAHRNLVVPANHHLGTQFTQILNEVIGERVVVVEDENHKTRYGYWLLARGGEPGIFRPPIPRGILIRLHEPRAKAPSGDPDLYAE